MKNTRKSDEKVMLKDVKSDVSCVLPLPVGQRGGLRGQRPAAPEGLLEAPPKSVALAVQERTGLQRVHVLFLTSSQVLSRSKLV